MLGLGLGLMSGLLSKAKAWVNLQTNSNVHTSATSLMVHTTGVDAGNSPFGKPQSLVTEDSTAGVHSVGKFVSWSYLAGDSYTVAAVVSRYSGTRNVVLRIDLGSSGFGNYGVAYDLDNLVAHPWGSQTGSIVSLGSGYYMLAITCVAVANNPVASYGATIFMSDGIDPTTLAYQGDGTSSMLIAETGLIKGSYTAAQVAAHGIPLT